MALAWSFYTVVYRESTLVCTPLNLPILPSAWLDCNCSRCRQQSPTGYPLTPIASTSKHSPDGPITIPCPLCHGRLVSQPLTSQQTDQSPALFSQGRG